MKKTNTLESTIEGPPPPEPHLAIFTDSPGTGLATGIPVGAVMAVVLDPTHPQGSQRLILAKVTRKTWTFKCFCSNPRCTVVYTFKATAVGTH